MISLLEHTLSGALLMLWETFWALVLGFGLSACLQVFVRRESMAEHFGRADLRSVGWATLLGAASSSCSYAAAATARTVFKKGAHLVPSLAFMFASTNLVLELGCVLWILLGWRFVLAEGVGSLVMIGAMWLLVKLTLPRGGMEQARRHSAKAEDGGCCHGHDHPDHLPEEPAPAPFRQEVRHAAAWRRVADAFFMDVSMMWKEVLAGFLIAGFLMTVVPTESWRTLFLAGHGSGPVRLVENCLMGVVIAVASFVCSVGNIPLASLLWSGGLSFGGVIAFIYADLLIIPLLLIYRKYYGARATAYLGGILLASMVIAGVTVDLLFSALGLVPTGPRPPSTLSTMSLAWNYTSWLDLVALLLLLGLTALRLSAREGVKKSKERVVLPSTMTRKGLN